jgi:hypothetical protein
MTRSRPGRRADTLAFQFLCLLSRVRQGINKTHRFLIISETVLPLLGRLGFGREHDDWDLLSFGAKLHQVGY